MYKPLIRIFKNARTYMDEEDYSISPKHLVILSKGYSTMYPIPVLEVRITVHVRDFKLVHQADFQKFVCQNEQTMLFGSTPEQWNIEDAGAFYVR